MNKLFINSLGITFSDLTLHVQLHNNCWSDTAQPLHCLYLATRWTVVFCSSLAYNYPQSLINYFIREARCLIFLRNVALRLCHSRCISYLGHHLHSFIFPLYLCGFPLCTLFSSLSINLLVGKSVFTKADTNVCHSL